MSIYSGGKMLRFNQIIKISGLVLIFAVNSFAGEKEITDMINQYLNNAKGGEIGVVEDLISDDADFIRINNIINQKKIHSKSDFLEIVKSGKFCNWASETNVRLVDFQENIAVAQIEYKNSKLIQKEYLTVVLSDDEWEIVNSVCSLSKK
jgi:hypothetical protein